MGPTTFIGIDLGGARGKTTAVATLVRSDDGAAVVAAGARSERGPWSDDELWAYLSAAPADALIAVGAPLTPPACLRCVRPVCPGAASCEDPAVVWLRTSGKRVVEGLAANADTADGTAAPGGRRTRVPLVPYLHRATDVSLAYERGLIPTESLGASTGAVAGRARQLRRRLAGAGVLLGERLIEVSAPATLAALFGSRRARAARRDAEAWHERARMIGELPGLTFSPRSRFAREDALARIHVFDALIAAYTAARWAQAGCPAPPDGPWVEDGWIVLPPERG